MALKIGDLAPEFELPSTSGVPFRLSEEKGKALVLYFYPKDFTRVCTRQACSFRDQFEHLRELGIPVWGISRDSLDTHQKFRSQYQLPFHLLCDKGGIASKLYEARVPIIGLPKRVTYLLDSSGRIAFVHDEMLGDESHVVGIKDAIRSLDMDV